jgi:hypothetical protein
MEIRTLSAKNKEIENGKNLYSDTMTSSKCRFTMQTSQRPHWINARPSDCRRRYSRFGANKTASLLAALSSPPMGTRQCQHIQIIQ